MTSLANALIDTIKESVSAEFLAVVAAFLIAEGDEWSADKMMRLQVEVAKIAITPKSKKKATPKKTTTTKASDMSERCQGCEWKGGKIRNAWCKKGGEHTFQVDGETVKCCDKHFAEWEKVSSDPLKGCVGFAVAASHNLRTNTRFMGFFGVSATNSARRIPVFPGEHYAMQAGVAKDALDSDDKPLPSWIDKAMDLASLAPDTKNGRKKGVYMPSGGWEGAQESVKMDKDIYNLTSKSDTTTKDDEQTDETRKPVDETPKQTDETPKQTDETPKQTDDTPKQTDDAPKQVSTGKRKPAEYHGEDIYLERDQSGNVYATEEIIKWIKKDEQVNNPDYKGLLAAVNEPWGKFTDGGVVFADDMRKDAIEVFMDLGDGAEEEVESW